MQYNWKINRQAQMSAHINPFRAKLIFDKKKFFSGNFIATLVFMLVR